MGFFSSCRVVRNPGVGPHEPTDVLGAHGALTATKGTPSGTPASYTTEVVNIEGKIGHLLKFVLHTKESAARNIKRR